MLSLYPSSVISACHGQDESASTDECSHVVSNKLLQSKNRVEHCTFPLSGTKPLRTPRKAVQAALCRRLYFVIIIFPSVKGKTPQSRAFTCLSLPHPSSTGPLPAHLRAANPHEASFKRKPDHYLN